MLTVMSVFDSNDGESQPISPVV